MFYYVLKIIQNQDFKTLNSFFESLLSELAVDKDMLLSLNFIDKIIALITIRSVCISPDIDFENNKAIKVSKKIALSTVYKQLEQIQFTHECKIDDTFKIIFNIPNSLYYASIDELIESCIDEIYLNKKQLKIENENMIIAVADTLAKNAIRISDLYVVYEVWMRGIAASWETKGEMDYAINIYKALTTIFPNSYYNYYLLGEAYTKDGQVELATEAYVKACKLGFKGKECE
jgi:tetratricopeptide (TPR) repeat protein